jgi:NAD(P)H-nitrite reductase large subunit
MRYVIVGGGVAGTTAAEELRKLDDSAEITLISEEQHPLYSRVLLPHFMKGKVPRDRVFLKKLAWYAQKKIDWLPGVLVEKLDVKNKFVGCSDGREYEYDKLLIATGGEVRNLLEDKRGVSYFRSLDDADHFMQLIAERTDTTRGVVYGGGFIACEYLNLFKHFEVPTQICFRGEHFWTRTLLPESGAFLNAHIREQGVEVFPNTTIEQLTGEKELTSIATTTGEYSCDILGVGIGIQPDFAWLTDAGVEVNYGVRANEYLETNVPDVYTAGDIAEFYDPIVERHLFIGNWMSAMMQGRIVAKTMHGDKTAVNLVSSYATNAFGLEMIFIGDVDLQAADEVHVVGSASDGGMTQIFERNGAVVGAALLNRNTDRAVLTKAIKEKQPFLEVNLVKE